MKRYIYTKFVNHIVYSVLLCSVVASSAIASTATQDSWGGGPPHSRPYVAPWTDMFESSHAVDWSDTPSILTISSGFERTLFFDRDFNSLTNFTPADIDCDGDLDLFITQNNSEVRWMEKVDNEMTWIFHEIEHVIYQPNSLVSSDFDSNGLPDLAVLSKEDGLIMLYQTTDDKWELENIDRQFYRGGRLTVVDIDNDGSEDLIALSANPNSIWWWENPSSMNESWAHHLITNLNYRFNLIRMNDFIGNGENEIWVCNSEAHMPSIRIFRSPSDPRELWLEQEAQDWQSNISSFTFLPDSISDLGNRFVVLAIGKTEGFTPREGYFLINSDNSRSEIVFPRERNSRLRFIVPSDIDGDSDLDLCTEKYCFENINGEFSWIPHKYLPSGERAGQITSPMCFDLTDSGGEELLYIDNSSIWYIDHASQATRGELISHYLEPENLSSWKNLSWISEEPNGTSISMFFRYDSNADWFGPFYEAVDLIDYDSGEYTKFQYKVVLESDHPDQTPVLYSVTVGWD